MGGLALTTQAEDEVKKLGVSWRLAQNELEEDEGRDQAESVVHHSSTLLKIMGRVHP